MDPENKIFGRGPKELTGAVDLITKFKLSVHHDFFCKKPLPASISDTHYLHHVVGETEIRRGEGMELQQLLQNNSYLREPSALIKPFELETLRQAFQLSESAPVDLPSAEKGIPTLGGKSRSENKDKDRKHKKHKDRDKDKDKDREHKKHKHRHKDRTKDKDREKKISTRMEIIQNGIMIRRENMKAARILWTTINTRRVSIRAQNWTNWER